VGKFAPGRVRERDGIFVFKFRLVLLAFYINKIL